MNGQKENEVRRPFSSVPDIEAYYPSLAAETARSHIFRTLDRGEGIAILIGETGLGKTLLLRLLADQFEIDAPVLFLSSARISGRKSLFRQLLFQLRAETSLSDEDELRVHFLNYLRNSEYSRFILFVDNGDTLPIPVLDEFRTLLDMELGGCPRFRIAISGSSRFEEHLNLPRLSSFTQRIASRSWLDTFSRDETIAYIDLQMKRYAEDYGNLAFSSEGSKLVHKLADGVPRLINQICSLALYLSTPSEREISEKTVQKAWRLLQQIPEEPSSETASKTVDTEGLLTSEADDESSAIEFGVLDDESETSIHIEISPDDSLGEEKDDLFLGDSQSHSSAAEVFEITPPELSSNEIVEFGNLDDEAEEPDTSPVNEQIPSEYSVLTLDNNQVKWQEADSSNSSEESEPNDIDTDELVDETNADLTYDSMIREKLLRAFPEGGEDNEPEISSHISDEIDDEGMTDEEPLASSLPDQNNSRQDRYMEELRLLEMEVSQEADLISKIRKMHTGLNSFREDQSENLISEQKKAADQKRVSLECHPEISGSSSPKPSIGKRPFFNVFEKIYSTDRKSN